MTVRDFKYSDKYIKFIAGNDMHIILKVTCDTYGIDLYKELECLRNDNLFRYVMSYVNKIQVTNVSGYVDISDDQACIILSCDIVDVITIDYGKISLITNDVSPIIDSNFREIIAFRISRCNIDPYPLNDIYLCKAIIGCDHAFTGEDDYHGLFLEYYKHVTQAVEMSIINYMPTNITDIRFSHSYFVNQSENAGAISFIIMSKVTGIGCYPFTKMTDSSISLQYNDVIYNSFNKDAFKWAFTNIASNVEEIIIPTTAKNYNRFVNNRDSTITINFDIRKLRLLSSYEDIEKDLPKNVLQFLPLPLNKWPSKDIAMYKNINKFSEFKYCGISRVLHLKVLKDLISEKYPLYKNKINIISPEGCSVKLPPRFIYYTINSLIF
jgi:hypothetical protein